MTDERICCWDLTELCRFPDVRQTGEKCPVCILAKIARELTLLSARSS